MYTPAIPQDLLKLDASQEWPRQGNWTYDDFLRLPESDLRYEIIYGVLFVNAAPIFDHQYAVGEIFVKLHAYAAKNGGVAVLAPVEVHLANIARPVQPDVLFLKDSQDLPKGSKHLIGAPDLIVEVLSPSTRRKDLSVKLDAYEQAGVAEYWVVDLIHSSILVFMLPEGGREYVELGEFNVGDKFKSHLLPTFELDIATIFV